GTDKAIVIPTIRTGRSHMARGPFAIRTIPAAIALRPGNRTGTARPERSARSWKCSLDLRAGHDEREHYPDHRQPEREHRGDPDHEVHRSPPRWDGISRGTGVATGVPGYMTGRMFAFMENDNPRWVSCPRLRVGMFRLPSM